MLLDLDAATLTVWVNGERKGVMARPGMTDYYNQPVARLEGPLRWAVDENYTSVAIAGPLRREPSSHPNRVRIMMHT